MEKEDNSARPHTGKLEHGCEHYWRRCKIRAPCCDKIFPCRHCHNEAVSSLSNPKEHHELVRRDVKQVVCSLCNTEQQVAQICSNCGVKMGEYFCNICKFYDDDTSKGQFHCDDCGICRVGGRSEFFHCQKCGSCYAVSVQNNHVCVENSMKNYCPVCYEVCALLLFVMLTAVLKIYVGLTTFFYADSIFLTQLKAQKYRCPSCSKTMLNMSTHWEMLEMEIEANKMPEEYQYDICSCSGCFSHEAAAVQKLPLVEKIFSIRAVSAVGMPNCHLKSSGLVTTDIPCYHGPLFVCGMGLFQVSILCNDCNSTSKAPFHILGHKCRQCNSYNTRRISTPDPDVRS
ncbi:hypothetical protein EZV62_010503 [Acer yangbiense]|uniref:CHY-type domain-containing protein n=1 Tax=Acer yangbiense TaxID=1000413 RepID=A0A5C7I3J2_9ROSI|nr:hypothetical protein EZV62_010503 [Acer yangbiense]